MALKITGQDIASQRMWHKETLADDINVFRRLNLSNLEYCMINYSIRFACKEKIEKKTWGGKVRRNIIVQSHLHTLSSVFAWVMVYSKFKHVFIKAGCRDSIWTPKHTFPGTQLLEIYTNIKKPKIWLLICVCGFATDGFKLIPEGPEYLEQHSKELHRMCTVLSLQKLSVVWEHCEKHEVYFIW